MDHDMIELRYHDWSRGGAVDVVLNITSLAYDVTGVAVVGSSWLTAEAGSGISTETGQPILVT